MSARKRDENDSSNYSVTPVDLRALARFISSETADSFLQAILNLDLRNETGAVKFLERVKELMPRWTSRVRSGPLVIGPGHKLDAVKEVQHVLSMAWGQPTLLSRQLCILQLLATYFGLSWSYAEYADYRGIDWVSELQSRVDPFLLVGLRALQVADRMKYCPNPTCVAPYFIAKRRSQKYCSYVCAAPAQKEFKRQWWAEHGDAWRKARKASAKKSRRKRGKHA